MDPEVHLSEEEARSSAASIDREAERLNRVVTNLLDLGRIEGGALTAARELVELDEALERAASRLVDGSDTAPFTIEVAEGTQVEADPVLLDEVLRNLLDNAVVHTPPGTPVRIRSVALEGEPLVRLTIEDGGPGVPAEALPRLFEKFFRANPPGAQSRRGTGIGLAVVRGLVLAMGGRVAARASEMGGLAIDVDLPIARLPAGLVVD
jgi:K+-sensing histidine kinase KdpD